MRAVAERRGQDAPSGRRTVMTIAITTVAREDPPADQLERVEAARAASSRW